MISPDTLIVTDLNRDKRYGYCNLRSLFNTSDLLFDVRSLDFDPRRFGDVANAVRALFESGVGVFVLALPSQRKLFNIARLPAKLLTLPDDELPSESSAHRIVLESLQ